MLAAANVDLSVVVDLYAGSGALGIEALSRGAGSCVFVESDRAAVRCIRENLDRARVADRATVIATSVGRWRADEEHPATLVLADPPYDDAAAWGAISLALEGHVSAGTVLAVEHAARDEPPAMLAGFPLWRARRHGDGAVAIYRNAEASNREASARDGEEPQGA
jgi:16S rRNA (guanine966-N2)-methyltransferase